MDRHSVNLKDTGLLFLSLKPRLLKCTMPSMVSQKDNETGTGRENELPVEFLE